ncbi:MULTISPECIES: hypothetical protein [Paraclostridium]|uniref:Lipoprotein n=1 Tax=Paraclostridium benzoelyticum TaxID=1629550 RepID=A0A0M3DFQ0_9FIRM|nr:MULTISPECIES: hypothetical protein [Paraclostridium]KKY01113.1 hypothetical protein VN21_10615 [Paraclostridium benzoelyticum]MCU9816236.1 hypothetical protein [Paraclostridium sp. AKS73]MDM8129789.1 hypothetical protein [Paraclostridium benzoelyticum]
MNVRLTSIGILLVLFIFTVGCSKSHKTVEDIQETAKENEIENQEDEDLKEINIQELEQKLSAASYSSESEPIQRSMEGSLEYVKGILPEGVEEIDRTYESEVGVTAVIYKADGIEFEVRYMHPYKDNGKSDEYDLSKTAGIALTLK